MYDLFHFDSNEKVKHATVRYFMKSDAHHLAADKRDTRERERERERERGRGGGGGGLGWGITYKFLFYRQYIGLQHRRFILVGRPQLSPPAWQLLQATQQ